jgi:ATP-dependent RNA helicase RhlE
MTSPTQAAGDFAALHLHPMLLTALAAKNHVIPTPIQAQAIPALLDGRDLLGLAQTGTGKTYAFALPILHQLAKSKEKPQRGVPRALILAPTRELAVQIADNIAPLAKVLKLRFSVVMGGVSRYVQTQVMAQGLDVLIATPGRLMDLIRDRHAKLDETSFFVIDEADRMLDMGFIRDVRSISKMLPDDCQSALFSATMPREIEQFARELLEDPVRIQVASKTVAVEAIHQEVRFVGQQYKLNLLKYLLGDDTLTKVVVFARTKYGADKIVRGLDGNGISTRAIHGNKSQGQRQNALQAFREGKARVLIATDIAARGIDVPGISHVINFDLPMDAENYLHRIGRTGRAGASGASISFCDGSERSILKSIEKLMKQAITVNPDVPASVKVASTEAPAERQAEYVDPRRATHRRGGPPMAKRDGDKPSGERNYAPRAGAPRGRSNWKPDSGPSDRSDRRDRNDRPAHAERSEGRRDFAPRGEARNLPLRGEARSFPPRGEPRSSPPRDNVQRDYAGRDSSGQASEFDARGPDRAPAPFKPRGGFAGKPTGNRPEGRSEHHRSEHRSEPRGDSRPDSRGPRKPYNPNFKGGAKPGGARTGTGSRGPRAA